MLKLKELRTQGGISQQHLANFLNVSRSTVAMWETGKSEPDSSNLKKLSEFFNVSIDYLLGNSEQKENSPAVTNDDEAVSEEDAALLEAFRKADPATQDVIRRFLKSLEAE